MPATIIDDQIECDQCGDQVSETCLVDSYTMCTVCADDYPICEHCDRCSESTFETVDGGNICAPCARLIYTRCEHCNLFARDLRWTADGTDVCDSCADDFWDCEGCGDLTRYASLCEACERDDNDSSDLIERYSYKPVPRFHGHGPVFLGLELEINTPSGEKRDCAEMALRHLGSLGYLKEDCSIDLGFEIVTHPMSHDWAMDHFPWRGLSDLADAGADGFENGMHVHISRDSFDSPSHVYRWMKFLHRNAKQVTILARRTSEQWAAFYESDRRHIKDYAKGFKGDRYRAINTQNDHTFELRIFASTVKPREVKAALGLSAASVEYTRTLRVSDVVHRGGWTWRAFVSWLREHPEYAPLSRELEELACAS
ncbi:hypothetical protein AB0I53_19365 [Saccharopolyspora sp. NPDC050389]|uniref:hypothetical protein n=1 Tax=Saccharopolyspora sp. NPDC050389 TaxID=3155516 RepID=UPI0033EAF223